MWLRASFKLLLWNTHILIRVSRWLFQNSLKKNYFGDRHQILKSFPFKRWFWFLEITKLLETWIWTLGADTTWWYDGLPQFLYDNVHIAEALSKSILIADWVSLWKSVSSLMRSSVSSRYQSTSKHLNRLLTRPIIFYRVYIILSTL